MASLDHHIVFHLGGDPDEDPPPAGALGQVAAPAAGSSADGELGIDFDAQDDLDPSFRLVGGRHNLGNALARRMATPHGFHAAAFDGEPDIGEDIIGRLNDSFTQRESSALEGKIHDQCMQDERVAAATVRAGVDLATSSLPVDVDVEIAEGPFERIKPVSELTVEDFAVRG